MLHLFTQKDNCFVLVFLIGSLIGFTMAFLKRRGGIQLTGKIQSYFQNNQLHYIPLIQFEFDGVEQTLQSNRGFRKKVVEEGQDIKIYYKPDNSKNVRLVNDRRDIWYSLVLLCLGGISIVLLLL